MRDGRVGVMALAIGTVIAVAAILRYQAWWSIAFAIGGAAVAIFERRGNASSRSIVMGLAIGGTVVLAGMAAFFLGGSLMGGGTSWFAAGMGCLVGAVLLIVAVRRGVTRTSA